MIANRDEEPVDDHDEARACRHRTDLRGLRVRHGYIAAARASLIEDDDIDDFVARGWMDWHGGSLRITPLGQVALLRIRTSIDAVA